MRRVSSSQPSPYFSSLSFFSIVTGLCAFCSIEMPLFYSMQKLFHSLEEGCISKHWALALCQSSPRDQCLSKYPTGFSQDGVWQSLTCFPYNFLLSQNLPEHLSLHQWGCLFLGFTLLCVSLSGDPKLNQSTFQLLQPKCSQGYMVPNEPCVVAKPSPPVLSSISCGSQDKRKSMTLECDLTVKTMSEWL